MDEESFMGLNNNHMHDMLTMQPMCYVDHGRCFQHILMKLLAHMELYHHCNQAY